VALGLTFGLLACGDDDSPAGGDDSADGEEATDGGDGDGDGDGADRIDEAVLAACPATTTLIETTEWPACLAGKRVAGTEPFNGMACELRVGASGAFSYYRGGALAIEMAGSASWGSPNGTYQNEAAPQGRIFLASIAPDLPAMEGQPRITDIVLSFFGTAGEEDRVEVKVLDAALERQVYNCTVDAL
jgi:hypothetical protein